MVVARRRASCAALLGRAHAHRRTHTWPHTPTEAEARWSVRVFPLCYAPAAGTHRPLRRRREWPCRALPAPWPISAVAGWEP